MANSDETGRVLRAYAKVRVLAPGGEIVVLLHTWAIPDAVPDDEWVQQLCADLSARDVSVEPPETRWFLSGRAVVLVGRSVK